MHRAARFAVSLVFGALPVLGVSVAQGQGVVEKWVQRYNGPANDTDAGFAVAVDGSGNVVVTGYSTGSASSRDFYTAKYAAADGTLLWERRYNGSANASDEAYAIAVDGSGDVVVTGSSEGSNFDYYTAKYFGVNGALLWEKRYNGPANDRDEARSLAVDSSGNVVVTGSSGGISTYLDYYTAKYAGIDGALLWEKRYNGPDDFDDIAYAVGVDGSGNVVVTGGSRPPTSAFDYYTAKYAAATGALLWEKRYDGPAGSNNVAQAVALDGSGNVVVTGYSYAGGSADYDYYTAKYAAADGALIWEKRYNGPANSNDEAYAVVVDGSGNVIVTGRSAGIGTSADYYTAKYAAADGALLWESRYNGPANASDQASAVAVDASGNVVVTGASAGSGTGTDYYTAKYAAADGALLWEARYNGPANSGDSIHERKQLVVARDDSVIVTGVSNNGTNADVATVKYVPTMEIAVEQPVGVALSDGASRSFAAPAGGSASVTFTIRNNGGVDALTGLGITRDGANFADFTVTASPSAPVIPGGSTTFTVTFSPTTVGTKNAALHIANNDSDENPFDIIVTGTALSFSADTDGDGLNDAAEFNMAAFGFDWQTAQPALVNALYANGNGAGLYTLSQVQTLNADVPLLVRDAAGTFTLTIGVQKSTNLLDGFTAFPFVPAGTTINGQGKIEFEFTVPDSAAFFRVEAN